MIQIIYELKVKCILKVHRFIIVIMIFGWIFMSKNHRKNIFEA
ncbi:hypothetical protein [Paraclostridium sp.]